MKIQFTFLATMFLAVRAFCDEGLPILASSNWAALTNITDFYEFHSTTNLPPQVRDYILTVLGSMGVQARDQKKIAEPKEPLTAGSRLVWVATDGTNYIAHYEFLWSEDSQTYHTNYCIAAAFRDSKDGTFKCCNGGYLRRLKDYKDFIDYESKIDIR